MANAEGHRILSLKQLLGLVPFSRVTVWRKSRDPDDDFPMPIVLSPKRIGWHEHEIWAWLASRPRVTDPGEDAEQAVPEAVAPELVAAVEEPPPDVGEGAAA